MFRGIGFFIKFSLKHNKCYFFSRLSVEIIKIILAMVQIIVPRYVLNEIFGLGRVEYIAVYLGILLGANLAGGALQGVLKMCADNALDGLRGKFEMYMMEKHMNCDFLRLESREFQDLKNKAGQYINGPWNEFGFVCERAFLLFGYVFTLFSVIYLVAKINIAVILVFVAVTVLNTWINAKLKGKNMKLMRGFAPVLRRRGYYEDITKNPDFAKEIRLGSIIDWILEKYNQYMQLFCQKTVPIHRHNFQQKSILAITGIVQQGVTYGYLIWQVATSYITLGDFTMYFNAVNTFNNVLNSAVDIVLEITHYTAFYDDFEKYSNVPRDMRTGKENAEALVLKGRCEIEFCNVSFTYPGQKEPTLKNISVRIPFGQKISIVGENGAGKTTFVKLLTRLYDPTEGQILLNGVDIRKLDYDSYMKIFAAVFQDFQLFKRSVRDNIVLGDKNVDENRVDSVFRMSGLTREWKKGLDTQLYKDFDGDGVVPSGGEAQKLAICRAYYKNTAVCVLDEPTAALDPQVECEIYDRFRTLFEGKTVLFISHRLANSRICDRVLVFQSGKIVEDGDHEDLLRKQGLYSELFSMQAQYYTKVG